MSLINLCSPVLTRTRANQSAPDVVCGLHRCSSSPMWVLLLLQGHISLGQSILVPVMIDDLDVYVVMAGLGSVNVDPAGLSEGQEGAKAQQVDRSDEGKHRRPRACGFDQIPGEIHHQNP